MVTIAVMEKAEAMTTIRQAGITVEIMMMTIIKRNTPDMKRPMKYLLLVLAVIPLLAANGCSMFSSNRNAANDRDHPDNGGNANHSSGVNHGEYTASPGGSE
jgi:hypothetical protein